MIGLFLFLLSAVLFVAFVKRIPHDPNPASAQDKKREVILIYRLPASHPYWSVYITIMQTATNNLGMDFKSYSADWNFMKMTWVVQDLIFSKNRADVVALDNVSTEKGSRLIHLLNDNKIPILLVNAKYYPKDYKEYQLDKCKYLIGQIYADNFDAGYRLAKELVKKAPVADDGNIYMLALSGHEVTSVSIERVNGLKKAVSENKKIKLVKIVPAEWNKKLAKERFIFYKTVVNPKISAVWAANDDMAIGAIEGAEELGLKPGSDIFFTGINWSAEGLKKIEEGKLLGSMGGHYFEAGWAAVIMYDYFNGVKLPGNEWVIKMYYIDKGNINKYKKLLDENNRKKLNFKVFSKTDNPQLKKYDFDIIRLLEQLN